VSVWLDGPVAGPLVDGDLCEIEAGYRCERGAVMTAVDRTGRHVLVCGWHAERHCLVASVELNRGSFA
jgi:hypothetical protein